MDTGTLWQDVDSLKEVLVRDRWQLTDAEELTAHTLTRTVLRKLHRVACLQLADLDFRGVPLAQGFQSSERWLAVTECIDLHTARAEVAVSRALETKQTPTVSDAWRDGHLDLPRAAVIVRTLTDLDDAGVVPDDVGEAEELLAAHAHALAPRDLQKVAKAVVQRLAPEVDERHDDPATRTFTVATSGIGGETFAVVHGSLDQLGADTVTAAVDAFTPARNEFPNLCEAQLRGQALVAMADAALRTVAAGGAPGGPARAVTVTVPLSVLKGGPGSGESSWSGPVSATTARQFACDAQIVPVVLGGPGEPLDVGRRRRLVTAPLRKALDVRDRGCVWPGCHRPSAHTEAHHLVPWHDGGVTSLENLALFCSSHHHRLHAGQGWTAGLDEQGHPWVRTPGHLDPKRPRRFHGRFLAYRLGPDWR